MPKISVIMPAYNAETYIAEAIDSILHQTFPDFELIIINDHSQDRTAQIIRSCQDPRILYLENGENLGVAKALNRGLAAARGEYIARMDADDISLPERLEKQAAFLDAHPQTAVVAGAVELFGSQTGIRRFSQTPEKLRVDLLCGCCFAHPSVMMRRETVLSLGGYDPAFEGAEDYHLWARIAQRYPLASLPDPVLRYRIHPAQVTQTQASEKTAGLIRKIQAMQFRALGLEVSGETLPPLACPPVDRLPQTAAFLRQLSQTAKNMDRRYLRQSIDSILCRVLDTLPLPQAAGLAGNCGLFAPVYAARRLLRRIRANMRTASLRKRLKCRDFTIFSNNCWAGSIYQKYGLPYRTPTVGLFIPGDDFVRFCAGWQDYLAKELCFIPWEQARLHSLLEGQIPYPVARLGDIEIYFMHYPSPGEAREKWNRRAARVNPEKVIFKLSQRECCSREDVERFMALSHPHKVCFAHDPVPGAIHIPELKGLQGDEQGYLAGAFDETTILNQL